MFFNWGIPQISPAEVANKQKSTAKFILLDVREPQEFKLAKIDDPRVYLVPMTRLAHEGMHAFPEELKDNQQEVVVFCHLGSRSAQVVAWMQQNGWKKVLNMTGGIDAYSRYVDPAIRRY